MAQGEIKKLKPATSKKSNALGPKKGARVIAPKKANLIRQKKMTKVGINFDEIITLHHLQRALFTGHLCARKDIILNSRVTFNKLSAGLTAKTERTLAERAGHLELLASGKKNKDGKDGKGKK
ncbi:hypothetical protein ACO22_00234 [Paracoccidioides brasiliensis]|uniref:Uncharacterized protein n=1 Tax=Paracoccidioides brasiliensis TaxID=121759 RepID=A0A1D2JPX8_PARBR|nr:hypothetical protein ACO22_00234 [Paracoccidioides brasiliensis]